MSVRTASETVSELRPKRPAVSLLRVASETSESPLGLGRSDGRATSGVLKYFARGGSRVLLQGWHGYGCANPRMRATCEFFPEIGCCCDSTVTAIHQ